MKYFSELRLTCCSDSPLRWQSNWQHHLSNKNCQCSWLVFGESLPFSVRSFFFEEKASHRQEHARNAQTHSLEYTTKAGVSLNCWLIFQHPFRQQICAQQIYEQSRNIGMCNISIFMVHNLLISTAGDNVVSWKLSFTRPDGNLSRQPFVRM